MELKTNQTSLLIYSHLALKKQIHSPNNHSESIHQPSIGAFLVTQKIPMAS
jgi:hypothetical protein